MDAMAVASAEAQEIHDAMHVISDDTLDENELSEALLTLEKEVLDEEVERKAAHLEMVKRTPREEPGAQEAETLDLQSEVPSLSAA
jgi:hypothetical protein